jgi:hypothetical protein
VGQEAARPEEPQPQQDRPVKPAVEVERGAIVPPPIDQAVVPVAEAPAPPEGSTLALIDLTLDDSPADKGKQAVDVETAEASDQVGTSAALGGGPGRGLVAGLCRVSTRVGGGGASTLGQVDP